MIPTRQPVALARVALVVALASSFALCAWLYRDNHSLRRELAALLARSASGEISRDQAAAAASTADSRAGDSAAGSAATPRAGVPRWLRRPERPAVEAEPEKETRQQRRVRRQLEIAAMFGRLDGETVEEYRERMVPFITTALASPRERMADARRAAEQAAGVTDEQRAALDGALQDAHREMVALTNAAVASGDLTPYSRNWSGMLGFAGGMGAVLEGAENRIATILQPAQLSAIYDQGFEWGEYVGITAPWEELDPPPPPDDT